MKVHATAVAPAAASAVAALRPLDPALQRILGAPPLHDGDDAADYDALHQRLRAAVVPADAVEELWVRDVADLAWETLRLRRLQARALDASSGRGLRIALDRLGFAYPDLDRLVDGWRQGNLAVVAEVEAILERAGMDNDTIGGLALMLNLDQAERIDRLILQSEARRHTVLREIDRRRDALGVRMRAGLAEIEAPSP